MPSPNATIADVAELYFTAQFAECIEACHNLAARTTSPETRSELALFHARSLLRLHRNVEVEHVLSAASPYGSVDAELTASMLTAMARIQAGAADDGLARLDSLHAIADGHPSIRAEIELYKAYGYFAKRDVLRALELINGVDIDSDIIHARALQLQGFCFSWLGRKRDAAASYAAALSRLDRCARRDDVVAAAASAGLAVIAFELNDRGLMDIVEKRYAAMNWSPDIRYRHQVELSLATHFDFNGDLPKARHFAQLALQTANTNAGLRVGTLAQLARLANHGRDHVSAREHVDKAWRIINELHDNEVQGVSEAAWGILELARESAPYNAGRARLLFARHRTIHKNSLSIHAGSVQDRATQALVEALILCSEGHLERARQLFSEAHEALKICEVTPDAIESAHWLADLGDANMRWYVSGALAGVTNWMTEPRQAKL